MTINNNLRLTFVALMLIALLTASGCRRSNSSATTGGQPFRISSPQTDGAEPAIARAADGRIYVVWVDHGAKKEANLMIAALSSEGQMQSAAVRVNSQPGIATAWRGDPPTVAVAPDNTIFVGWTGHVESDSGHATNVYVSSSRDRGQTFGAPVKVNDDSKPAGHGMHSLAIGMDGRVYVAWLDERNVKPVEMKTQNSGMKGHHIESNSELFIASSTDGGQTFSRNERVATEVCPCCKTALAVDVDGRVYVSWRQVLPGDFRHIAVASSTDQAKTFTSPKIVSDDQWKIAGCPVSGPSLSVDTSNALSVLWYSAGKNGEQGLYWAQSRDNGASFSPRVLVAGGTIRGTPVLVSDGYKVEAVWEDDREHTAKVMKVALKGNASPSDSDVTLAEGELPAAVHMERRLVLAYIKKSGEQQSVWVVSAAP